MLLCPREHSQWKEHQIRENDQSAKANIYDWLPQCWHKEYNNGSAMTTEMETMHRSS